MHMSDALVSASVGTAMAAVSVGAISYSIKKISATELNNNKIPMMGVMGAFVFAAQMINFTIPGTGSSGHIGGGILLAALLGPYPAFLVLTSVLIIQALIFADGGLLALGCNIFNMGALTCFVAYPLIYRTFIKKTMSPRRISLASLFSVVIGLQLGAFAVVLETTASGVTNLPFGTFLILMQPIHLAIGIIEGIVTGAVLCFVYKVRKDILLESFGVVTEHKGSKKRVLLFFALAAVILGGFLSFFASKNPDGLEWSIYKITGTKGVVNTTDLYQEVHKIQKELAAFPKYSLGNETDKSGTGLSGLIGGFITLIITVATGIIIIRVKKYKMNKNSSDKEATE